MLPLRDDIPAAKLPFVTGGIIILNLLAFLHQLTLGAGQDVFLLQYAVIPGRYTIPEVARLFSIPEQTVSFLTSIFLHGGWLHLLGNMWTLWIFGDNVEDRLGHGRYLLLYLASGLAASLLHILTNPASLVPTIGASGAIAGIMGAYFRFYPSARIETLIPPFFLGPTFVFPAIVFLGWWFLVQFLSGAVSLGGQNQHLGGVAWWAHVGGFVFGAGVCLAARRLPRRPRTFEQQHYQD